NSAFSLPSFMTYRASLWDTIRLLHLPHYVTVIATQKLDDKDKQVGIFFDRNRLN
ncbi:MAG: hypothetical protein BECKG1743E_GA0114224_102414, partial [Candidatus Kentron sp. G]